MLITGNQNPRGWGFDSPVPSSHASNHIEVKRGRRRLCCRRWWMWLRRDSGNVFCYYSFFSWIWLLFFSFFTSSWFFGWCLVTNSCGGVKLKEWGIRWWMNQWWWVWWIFSDEWLGWSMELMEMEMEFREGNLWWTWWNFRKWNMRMNWRWVMIEFDTTVMNWLKSEWGSFILKLMNDGYIGC